MKLRKDRSQYWHRFASHAFLTFFGLLFCFNGAKSAQVLSVGDGDTVRISEGGRKITVRLACIDAPESSQQPWGERSTSLLRQLIPIGSEITLEMRATDRYGRTVAELINDSGNVNQQMVRVGQAFAYQKYLRQCDANTYLQLEGEARRQGLGVWAVGPSGITRPWDYRRNRQSLRTSGSGSRKYRCKNISSWNRAQQLLAQGHRYLDGDGDGEACESLR